LNNTNIHSSPILIHSHKSPKSINTRATGKCNKARYIR
jgi:hypothetical protein